MEILHRPLSPDHKSAMFFNGIIARKSGLELRTYQDGEINFKGNILIGFDIIKFGNTGLIDDEVLEEERDVSILVDKFFTITKDGEIIDDNLMFDDYDEAIKEFEKY